MRIFFICSVDELKSAIDNILLQKDSLLKGIFKIIIEQDTAIKTYLILYLLKKYRCDKLKAIKQKIDKKKNKLPLKDDLLLNNDEIYKTFFLKSYLYSFVENNSVLKFMKHCKTFKFWY